MSIELDREAKEAFLTWAEFKALPEYSTTNPTGTTPGKMWKRQSPRGPKGEWFLCEYEAYPQDHPDRDKFTKINIFRISIVQESAV